MEQFIRPVEILRKTRNTFRGITFFQFLTKRPKFSVPFDWITSARLYAETKRKINWYFVNGTTQSLSCFRCQKNYHGIFHQNFRTNGVTIGFSLPSTNRGLKRKDNSSDFGVRTTRGKTNSQLAWLAGKELVTIPRYRICYNWKQDRTQTWTSTV